MGDLFCIKTDRISLEWSQPRGKPPVLLGRGPAPAGRLVIRPRRHGLRFGPGTWRSGVPESVANDPDQVAGPPLFEQTDYVLYARTRDGHRLRLQHRDQALLRDLRTSGSDDVAHGVLNFGSQVGRSDFSIEVDGECELDFQIEVFPSKLDYFADYQQLVAEVQDILTGLVVEYLRSTFQLGSTALVPQPTHVEWLTVLRHVFTNLERGLLNIARQPIRANTRSSEIVRAERIRRVDSRLRRHVLRGTGTGRLLALSPRLAVRERLTSIVAGQTLNTPEHRWLAAQLSRIRRRLVELAEVERKQEGTARREVVLREVTQFERRVAEVLRLDPFKGLQGDAPSGFASMQLLSTPGYREAYKSCLVLLLGLRLTGGPIRLGVKDLSVLYEYWCYLAILKVAGEAAGCHIPASRLLTVEQNGLRVTLQKGRETTVPFELPGERRLAVTYNPLFKNKPLLISQQPDFVLSIYDREWPTVRLVVDAKYRIDSSGDYAVQYGSPGPPEDAINVLHRYRDAILDAEPQNKGELAPKRTVVEGVVLFPYREVTPGQFRESRLWQAVQRLGIGAVPALPESCGYLQEWLCRTLRMGGWAIADMAIPYRSHER